MSPNYLNTEEQSQTFERCESFYGISLNVFNKYELLKSRSGLWLVKKESLKNTLHYDTAGLRVFSGENFPYKPTLSFFTFFESHISKGFLNFNDKETKDLIFRREILINKNLKGYLGIKNREHFVGVGLAKEGLLLSQVPKKIANQISDN